MDTVLVTIPLDASLQELLIAELADLGFNAFEQEPHRLKAYTPAPDWDDATRTAVERWLSSHTKTAPAVDVQRLRAKNWNQQWESTIQPLAVGPFLITPTWADVPPEHAHRIVLTIDPKMSFGTGYHESTRLVLRLLPDYVSPTTRVLDVGTGTGILAIAALKLGAASALAVDTDTWAQRNAADNVRLNDVEDQIELRPGSLDVVAETGFDLLLANINRPVLLKLLPGFAEKTCPDGYVVLSGLLQKDRGRMIEAATEQRFGIVQEATENDWWAAVLQRSSVTGLSQ